ncbi:MAG: hypothetical protein WD042_10480 [Phycisphaeraceae bacterium]
MIDFKCSQCGEGMEAPESLAGQTQECPKCGAMRRVPGSRSPDASGELRQPRPQGNLVNCPDCGRQISRLAPTCLGCGRPMNQMGTPQIQPTTMIEATSKRFKKQEVIGFVIGLPGLILAVIGVFFFWLAPGILVLGCVALCVGFGVMLIARIRAWWHHG